MQMGSTCRGDGRGRARRPRDLTHDPVTVGSRGENLRNSIQKYKRGGGRGTRVCTGGGGGAAAMTQACACRMLAMVETRVCTRDVVHDTHVSQKNCDHEGHTLVQWEGVHDIHLCTQDGSSDGQTHDGIHDTRVGPGAPHACSRGPRTIKTVMGTARA